MACRFSAIGAPVASARYTKTMADARTPRWYRLTPDRVVVALLALEFVLLLSAWFQWFAFNRHKGWSVLVAIAGVGLALLLMFLWFLAALIFRWRFQFSIRALLLLVVVVAIPFSWLETEIQQARKQRVVWSGLSTCVDSLFTITNSIRLAIRYQVPNHPAQLGCGTCWETTCWRTWRRSI